jgi:uncharacterized protein YlxW (UPF0749 family)
MPRSAARKGSHARQRWPLAVMGVCAASGLLFVTAAVSASGDDLRPTGGDLGSLLRERSQRIDDRRATAHELQETVDDLSGSVEGTTIDELQQRVTELQPAAGLTAMRGPGLRVELDDAPSDAGRPGLDPKVLYVHEQDIQAYVNAMWAGGAEAISLQGQRLISTSGIKCVGNTVLINGRQYSPPYRIDAVGDVTGMISAINTSPATITYADYVDAYQLGLKVSSGGELTIPAYEDQVGLQFASAAPDAS